MSASKVVSVASSIHSGVMDRPSGGCVSDEESFSSGTGSDGGGSSDDDIGSGSDGSGSDCDDDGGGGS